jgi:hypothetical protein
MINTKNSDYYVKSVVTLKVTTGFFAFSNLNICIAVVKEEISRTKSPCTDLQKQSRNLQFFFFCRWLYPSKA